MTELYKTEHKIPKIKIHKPSLQNWKEKYTNPQ